MIKSHSQLNKCKTRDSRWKNRLADSINRATCGRWPGVVPKSMALTNHCKARNYGRNCSQEQARRLKQ